MTAVSTAGFNALFLMKRGIERFPFRWVFSSLLLWFGVVSISELAKVKQYFCHVTQHDVTGYLVFELCYEKMTFSNFLGIKRVIVEVVVLLHFKGLL